MKKFIIEIWKSLLTQTWLSQSAQVSCSIFMLMPASLNHSSMICADLDVVGIVRRRLEDEIELAGTVARLREQLAWPSRCPAARFLSAASYEGEVGKLGDAVIRPSPHSAPCSSASLSISRSIASRTLLVLERLEIVIDVDEVPVEREPGDDLELRIALDLLHPVGRDVVDHVHFAGAQAGQAHRRLGHLPRDHLVEIGRAVPIVVEAREFDLVAEFAAHELERPGADRRLALLVSRALRDDRRRRRFRRDG